MQKEIKFSEYQCPQCGWKAPFDWCEEDEIKPIKVMQLAPGHLAFLCPNAQLWREYWKCPFCGTEFNFQDSNC